MVRTYSITPGAQYDQSGVTVECGPLSASYDADGNYLAGQFFSPSSIPELGPAIRRVLDTRAAEILTIGEEDTPYMPQPGDGDTQRWMDSQRDG